MPFNLGGPEVMVILVIVLIVFGAGKLPNVMRDLGSGVREFKKAQSEVDSPSSTSTTTDLASPAPAAPTTLAARQTSTAATAPGTSSASAPAATESQRPVETSVRA